MKRGQTMNKVEFSILLGKVAASKMSDITKAHMDVYWENLQGLPYLHEVLTNASKKTYKRSMPQVSELLEDHKLINSKKLALDTVKERKRLSGGRVSGKRINGFPEDVFYSISEILKNKSVKIPVGR